MIKVFNKDVSWSLNLPFPAKNSILIRYCIFLTYQLERENHLRLRVAQQENLQMPVEELHRVSAVPQTNPGLLWERPVEGTVKR